MSTTIFVRDGTARGNTSLCHTCRHAHIQKGYSDSEEEVRCGYFWDSVRLVVFPVRDCTDYLSKLVQTVEEMKKVAVLLDSQEIARRHKAAGFSQAAAAPTPPAENVND